MREPEKEISRVWEGLKRGDTFRTPDNSRGVIFSIARVNADKLFIHPQQGVSIHHSAFIAALDYLLETNSGVTNKCEIRSSNDSRKAGPLFRASRDKNNNVRCINYIVPILRAYGIVDCSGDRPNKVWLV